MGYSSNRKKEYSLAKAYWGWARIKMARSWEGFEDDKPLWKERRGHLLQFPDHKATEKENLRQKPQKNKRKRKGKKSGCHNLTPLKKSRPQDLVAQEQVCIY